MLLKRILPFLLIAAVIFGAIPSGYYDGASGLNGTELRSALHDIIDNHTVRTYANLWTDFRSTDVKLNGKVWDMYSDTPGNTPPYEYTFVTDQCGSYSSEGDCYNREHSWPKSWFNDASPMYSDLFHLYPTDGKVNGMRSNYAYGEVATASWTSANGSKLGSCNIAGFSGTVFEPIDAYKGDLARSYFYMTTRYYGEDGAWSTSDMTDKAEIKPWALEMLITWHNNDPVSDKEIDRNEAIYGIQHNRNPFIDHPEYVSLIWSDAPANPSGLNATETGVTYTILSWTDNSDNENGFYIYQDNVKIQTLATNSISTTIEGLAESTQYTFSVSAFNSDGESSKISATITTASSGSGNDTTATELFISEYVEGSSNNKALELFNGTGIPMDLSDYSLLKQSNGAGDFGSELVLSGTLNSGSTYVIAADAASATLQNLADLVTSSQVIYFNGNDAVALHKNDVRIDVVGVINSADVWGAEVTLVRNSSVHSPALTYNTNDWDVFPQDYFDNLGLHTIDDTSLPVNLFSFTASEAAGTVKLTWTTASESENAGFIIYRQEYDGDFYSIASWRNSPELTGSCCSRIYQYSDPLVEPGCSYTYLLADQDFQGQITKYWDYRQQISPGSAATAIPGSFILEKAYPNPFNAELTLHYKMTESSRITVNVFSLKGELTARLWDGFQSSGNHSLTWSAENIPSGIYLLNAVSNNTVQTQKVILLK